jgi:uncharacterized membrane protein
MSTTPARIQPSSLFLRFSPEWWEIIGVYFFLLAGSLWHVLGVLQTAMKILSAPVVIALALWIAFRYDQTLRRHRTENVSTTTTESSATARFHYWSVIVGVVCFALEYIGAKTGLIFGKYQYQDVWIPALNGVPVAISCAWLVTLYGSFAIVQRFTTRQHSIWFRCLLLAACMTVFDVFMEPVAVKLHYWTWLENTGNSFFVAPLQNYAAWFGISYALGWFALRSHVFETALPRVAWHSYWAQLLYFAIIALCMPS